MNDLRFASLRGASRRHIDDFDDELFHDDVGDAFDPELDLGYEEPSHDGWSEIRPLYEAMRSAHDRAMHDHT